MARMKTYAVEITVTTKHILFVDARKPNGARAKLLTEEGWREATRYHDDENIPRYPINSGVEIIGVRETGL